MQEFDVVVTPKAGVIECNFDEIKEALKVQMSAYADVVVAEDEIPIYKTDLATLRKIRKAVDDKRKDVKKEYNKPLDDFESKVKELLAEIDKPIELIDSQLKMYEEERVAKKKERITAMYKEYVGEYLEYLPIETNFNEKWTNKSFSDNDIKYDISEKIVKVKNDIAIINSLNSEITDELIKAYKEAGNELSVAIQRNQQYLADKARIEEAKEAETKAQSKEIVPETKGTALDSLNHLVEVSDMVKFVVSKTDMEQIKELLEFSQIPYRIEE